MSIWKTLRQEKPDKFDRVIVLTKKNEITKAFYNPEDGKFWNEIGLAKPIQYKRWCYEEDLVKEILDKIKIEDRH